MDDPKAIVRRGYDRVSRAYLADDAEERQYGAWLELLEERVEPSTSYSDTAGPYQRSTNPYGNHSPNDLTWFYNQILAADNLIVW